MYDIEYCLHALYLLLVIAIASSILSWFLLTNWFSRSQKSLAPIYSTDISSFAFFFSLFILLIKTVVIKFHINNLNVQKLKINVNYQLNIN